MGGGIAAVIVCVWRGASCWRLKSAIDVVVCVYWFMSSYFISYLSAVKLLICIEGIPTGTD